MADGGAWWRVGYCWGRNEAADVAKELALFAGIVIGCPAIVLGGGPKATETEGPAVGLLVEAAEGPA